MKGPWYWDSKTNSWMMEEQAFKELQLMVIDALNQRNPNLPLNEQLQQIREYWKVDDKSNA